jgi:TonB-linked SusC/RagA family outer membrane protein
MGVVFFNSLIEQHMKRNKITKWVDGIEPRSSDGDFVVHSQWHKRIKGKWMKFAWFLVLFLAAHSLAAQQNSMNVQVVDHAGKPLAGARVELINTPGVAALTNDEGQVTFNVAPVGWVKISYQSMVRLVAVNTPQIQVRLDNTDKKIQLGFGREQEVEKVTSSIDVVYADQLEKSTAMNPEESLYGQLTGLSVLQNGGEPWNRSPDMFIRGRGTFNNSSILVLVDGFERDMASLALEEIESVSVLKDGAALAIYGQRGANGAILVTTKRGEYKSFHVDFKFEQGFNTPFRTPEFLNGYDYARAVNEASALDGNPFVYSEWDLQDYQSGNQPFFFPNVDWMSETLKDYGTNTNFNASFRGGGETVRYFVALNYQNERGMLDNTTLDDRYNSQMKYDRFNFRTNLDIDLTRTTKFRVNVAGSINGRNEPGARVSGVMNALFSVPSGVFPIESINGVWGGTEFYDNNPVALVSSTGVRTPHSREINADGHIIQDLSAWVDGLSAEVAVGYDNSVGYWESKTRGFLYESVAVTRDPSTGAIRDTTVASYGSETDLNASDSFGGQRRHATIYGKVNYDTSWDKSELTTSLIYHQDKRVNDGQYNTFLHQSLIASASYGYLNKYYIDGVLSYSGSNILPDGDRFGLFPSLSAGWIASRENFLKDSRIINFMKVRASMGMSGNDRMSANLYDQGFFSGGNYFFTNNNTSTGGIVEGQLPAFGLSYEKSVKSNFGLDFKLLNHLQLNVDAFYEKRSQILASTNGSVPSLIGVARPVENVGEVENKGVEVSLMWKERIGDFSYHLGGNFSYAKNKILEMNEEFQPYDYLKQTGNRIGQQFGLEALGFFADQTDIQNSPRQLFSVVRPGDIKYKDQNNDGVIDQLDQVPIGYGSGYPEVYYASTIGLEYKGFGVDALFQGIANHTLFLNTKSVFWPLRGQNTISTFSSDRWTPETAQSATLPRLSLLENANNYQKNDIWLTKGDYLKLRRLEIYYRFSDQLLDKLNMKSARIFARGMNLFSIDMVDVLDPEEIGVTYPTLSSWHFGINLGF